MLTKELIQSRNSTSINLSDLKKLNIYGQNISNISIISSMIKLEYLSLSSNNISSLSPLSNCIHLREIYLRNNKIKSFEELKHLRPLFNLRVLWLEGNPICDDDFYRKKVLNILPQIISLDNKNRILKRERVNVKKRHQSEGRKRNKNIDINSNIDYSISKSQRKKILLKRVFSCYDGNDDDKIIETLNDISLRHKIKKYQKHIFSVKKNDINELKIRFNTKANIYQRDKDKDKVKNNYKKLKLKLINEENKTNHNNINNMFNNYFDNYTRNPKKQLTVETNKEYMPIIKDNNITELNSICNENNKFNFFRNVNKEKNYINKLKSNNYIMNAMFLLVDKMNVNDLVSLKKVINKRISVLSKLN